MEGKGLLFKIFAGIDVFDIEVNEKDPEKFIQTVKAISPTFGGINLEDIKAPECFEIETRLKNELDIPCHARRPAWYGNHLRRRADQRLGDRRQEDRGREDRGERRRSRLYLMYETVRDAGSAQGEYRHVRQQGRHLYQSPDLNAAKREFATDRPIKTLQEAVVGADVFLGLSVANVLTKEMVRSMNADPIVFALANPNPEISYADAMAFADDIIFATGRSDYPNQINNVLGFPYIFRGALDTHAKAINEENEAGRRLRYRRPCQGTGSRRGERRL